MSARRNTGSTDFATLPWHQLSQESKRDAEEVERYRATDPAWQGLRADREWQDVQRQLAKAWATLPTDMHHHERLNHPTMWPLWERARGLRGKYGVDERAPWEMNETPGRFVVWLDRCMEPQLRLLGVRDNLAHAGKLEEVRSAAVRLAKEHRLPLPPTAPKPGAPLVEAEEYLLALRRWAGETADSDAEWMGRTEAAKTFGVGPHFITRGVQKGEIIAESSEDGSHVRKDSVEKAVRAYRAKQEADQRAERRVLDDGRRAARVLDED